ncbi:spore coat protein YlbD [Alteribacillus sp. HJP-4]|uniref:spore coat protein YlbD n=1 Tax=Alteribacillus sp. HJP-4 TaxID=2775394 RepID=UPI0035CCE8F4
MSGEQLPASIQEFRTFILNHPGLIKEVRRGQRDWNSLYQDWIILGEDHEEWKEFLGSENAANGSAVSSDSMSQIMKALSQINVQELQQQLSQFSGMMGNAQRVLQHFQKPSAPPRPPRDPFSFRGF